ncbi:nicotinate-nucleotide adenylyltransferase [Thioclava nitratireducens]|uniref:nicotinate-nucleotide adenylyltransferase n=1 Tax=Thioclava nitratireducens TaxID=1915078 RepID=UPI0024808F9F|nr:nicotinate-nucleotide adenylyltransferase [Thioclava nitratireducens]WGT49107.1 nicotinate-nucleotide adenylyltransferase [Thioclava nitratireducens]
MRQGFPFARAGQRIGLLGGSFDPAHEGHVLITREALRRFNLDRVWWVVSPGNPLKAHGPAPLDQRIASARAILGGDPRVVVTDIEARLGTRYTADTITALRALYPGVNFAWLMGADNLVQLDRWDHWRTIIESVSIGVLARPGWRMPGRWARAARIYAQAELPAVASQRLLDGPAPRWCFVNIPMSSISSTEIREKGGWGASTPA